MPIAIIVEDKKIKRKLGSFRKEYDGAMTGFYYKGGAITQRQMRINAPKGVSGIGVGETITFEVSANQVVISPKKKYGKYDATVIERGRRPGKMPPWRQEDNPDFFKWAEAHGIPPFALARSIGLHGTKANPFVKKTYDDVYPIIKKLANDTVEKLCEDMKH